MIAGLLASSGVTRLVRNSFAFFFSGAGMKYTAMSMIRWAATEITRNFLMSKGLCVPHVVS
jgi:hypothetical protein